MTSVFWRRSLVCAAALAVFGPGALAFTRMAQQSPTYNESLLIEGADGSTRRAEFAAMYDHGAYLFQTGYGFLVADTSPIATLGTPRTLTDSIELRARATIHLEDSLRLDPANGHAWQAYARSVASLQEPEIAALPLERSAALAPTTLRLAVDRLVLVALLRDWSGDPGAYAGIEAADVAVLEARSAGGGTALMENLTGMTSPDVVAPGAAVPPVTVPESPLQGLTFPDATGLTVTVPDGTSDTSED